MSQSFKSNFINCGKMLFYRFYAIEDMFQAYGKYIYRKNIFRF